MRASVTGAGEMKPLLVIDGDSFAHRAFHALPRTIRRADGRPANALVGFMQMLLRLWQAERPRAVVVGWDTLTSPTYRNELLPGYQSGQGVRPRAPRSARSPARARRFLGHRLRQARGVRGRRLPRGRRRSGAARGGTALVATSDRDAFQLADERVTILQPVRGVSELARIGPAEVRARYGVEPDQVPDFIALRGDPSDKIPGARGVGEKTAASLLHEYPDLDSMLAAGRFAAEADRLREFLRSRPSTRRPRCPISPTASPIGPRRPTRPRRWGSIVLPRA